MGIRTPVPGSEGQKDIQTTLWVHGVLTGVNTPYVWTLSSLMCYKRFDGTFSKSSPDRYPDYPMGPLSYCSKAIAPI